MKFVCDKCNSRYSIADDRVRGRVLKIRCKACDHVITVREPATEPEREEGADHTVVSTPGEALAAVKSGDSDEWYVSFDGEQEGPMPIARAIERIKVERPRGKEIHGWRPGFFVWLPLEEVPDFMRLLEARPAAQPPRIPITAGPRTRKDSMPPIPKEAAQPAPRPGTGPVVSPVVSKDPTGPRAALAVAAPGSPMANVPTLDSRPLPLPPLPEPPSPLGSMDSAPGMLAREGGAPQRAEISQPTRPELKNAYRKADPTGPAPSLGAKALADAPTKRPLPGMNDSGKRPALSETGKKPALPSVTPGETGRRAAMGDTGKKPALGETGKKPALPSMSEPAKKPGPLESLPHKMDAASDPDISPFAAALAASGDQAAADRMRNPETGPVPLPPPPEELPIGEASGLLNLSHIAAAAAAQPRPPRAAVETFGGQTVTPPMGSNGAPSSPQPVVVVAGPAPRGAPSWMKWAALGGIALSLVLGMVLIYVLTRGPGREVAAAQPPKADDRGTHVDDRPIAMVGEPVVTQTPQAAGADGKKPAVVHRAGVPKLRPPDGRPRATIGPAPGAPTEEDDGPGGHALHIGARTQQTSREVSQPAIAQVVSSNHRSLGLCYERVLKHDNTLKKAKVTTKVKVGVSGAVKSVVVEDAEYAHSEIGQCLVQAMRQWHFPPNAEEYETEIPLLLQAN